MIYWRFNPMYMVPLELFLDVFGPLFGAPLKPWESVMGFHLATPGTCANAATSTSWRTAEQQSKLEGAVVIASSVLSAWSTARIVAEWSSIARRLLSNIRSFDAWKLGSVFDFSGSFGKLSPHYCSFQGAGKHRPARSNQPWLAPGAPVAQGTLVAMITLVATTNSLTKDHSSEKMRAPRTRLSSVEES